ncbi:MAG: binding-protein-dependent transport system inner rane component [Firmicutes bacterium]|nr:binding-protein-dependent transport system inner rane component [Bacillota bacterium]
MAAVETIKETVREKRPPNRAWRRFRRSRSALVGSLILGVLILLVILVPVLHLPDPIAQNLPEQLKAPSAVYPFGTDEFGRDLFSRVLHGGLIAVETGLVAVAVSVSVGILLGLIAGYFGGAVDVVIMAVMDVLLAFPYLLLAMIVVAILGPGLYNAMIAVGIVYVPTFARLVRGVVLQVREMDYVQAAHALGAKDLPIMLRHVLRNCLGPILVQASLSVGWAIVNAASLSFLGLGAQPPTPEWGAMMSNGREYLLTAWWITTFPGLAILVTALGCNLLGDGLRDALDPKGR